MNKCLLYILFFAMASRVGAQDLLEMLDSIESEETTNYVNGTFKSVRLINGYTAETAGKNDFVFSISHRFGKLNSGAYNLFGLDESTIRFGFEYGLTDRIDLGIGRSNYEKLFDGFVKVKLLRQSKGKRNIPLSVTWLEGAAIKSLKWTDETLDYPFSARMYYVHELFIASKITKNISLQLVPIVLHRNMVETRDEQNVVTGIGAGGRYKITHWFTFSGEYFYILPGNTANNYYNSLSVGFELETGGHIFQLNFSNSKGMTEKLFFPQTNGRWLDGNIYFGFNIMRVFSFK